MAPRLVILLGPPACGKGTQAKLLGDLYGWRTFSTGAAIRSHVQQGTEFGKRFEEMLGSAYLLPDSVILELVKSELEDHTGGLILDGFPRTVPQACMFDDLCAHKGWKIDAVISFEASEQALEARVANRLTCMSCGGTYRQGMHGLLLDSPCPHCGGKLGRRKDDSSEVFKQRFQEFLSLTQPLVDFYKRRGLLHRIDALTPSNVLALQLESYLTTLK